MQKWEYRIIDSINAEGDNFLAGKSREAVEKYLNDLGKDGWEVVNLDFVETETRMSFVGVAKRPQD